MIMLLSRPEFKDQIYCAETKRGMNEQAWLNRRLLPGHTGYEAHAGGLKRGLMLYGGPRFMV